MLGFFSALETPLKLNQSGQLVKEHRLAEDVIPAVDRFYKDPLNKDVLLSSAIQICLLQYFKSPEAEALLKRARDNPEFDGEQ